VPNIQPFPQYRSHRHDCLPITTHSSLSQFITGYFPSTHPKMQATTTPQRVPHPEQPTQLCHTTANLCDTTTSSAAEQVHHNMDCLPSMLLMATRLVRCSLTPHHTKDTSPVRPQHRAMITANHPKSPLPAPATPQGSTQKLFIHVCQDIVTVAASHQGRQLRRARLFMSRQALLEVHR
jgi:hypothetical protein